MKITCYRNTQFWTLYDKDGEWICVAIYRKGAEEVKRRLQGQ